MKKIRGWLLGLMVACGLMMVGCQEEPPEIPLSGATDITITEVCGEDVTGGAVTLTTAQYNELVSASNKGEKVAYTLAEGAEVAVTLEDKTLNFAITAEDGTTASASVTITVLSNATAIEITKVCNVDVTSGTVTLTTAQYNELISASDKGEKVTYTLAEGATVAVTLDDKTLNFAITAEDGTTASASVTITVLSNDTALTITKVCNVNVTGGAVTLTTAQYNELISASNKGEKVTYTLAEGATVAVTLEDKTLNFAITAEDGTTASASVTITVLSNQAEITLTKVNGKSSATGVVTMSQEELTEFSTQAYVLSNYAYEASEKSTVTAEYEVSTHTVVLTCISEDGSAIDTASARIEVEMPFGSHSRTGAGSAGKVSYDYENNLYLLDGDAIVKSGANNLSDVWAFQADFCLAGLEEGNEVRLVSSTMKTAFIRFVLRATDSNHFNLFTDYQSESGGYRSYFIHRENVAYTSGDYITLGIINVGDSVIVTFNGETVYRTTLHTQFAPELLLSTWSIVPSFKNVEIVSDKNTVEEIYDSALVGYVDPAGGKTSLGTGSNYDQLVTNADGSGTIAGANSTTRVLTALYDEGTPIEGHRYAFYSRLTFQNTRPASSGAASKLELQLFSDYNNFFRFYIWRHPTNNRILRASNINGVSTNAIDIKARYLTNCDPASKYVLDFAMVYDGKTASFWLKEISAGGSTEVNIPTWTKEYEFDAAWGYTAFIAAMNQYIDITFSNTRGYYNDEFDAFVDTLRTEQSTLSMSANKDVQTQECAFDKGANNTFVKSSEEYENAYLFDGENAVAGNDFLVHGGLVMPTHKAWSQAEVQVAIDSTHALRYVFEYVDTGVYQVFFEYKNGQTYWQGWRAVLSSHADNAATLNFAIVNHNGTVSFLIDGYVYHTASEYDMKGANVLFGGKAGTVKVYNLSVNTDEQTVAEFAANMQEYTYVSPYQDAIATREEMYKNAAEGGALFFGSSTMDYWETYAADCGLEDGVTGYNVGIGGTIVEDWLYAYDRLVAKWKPTKFILFLGGNNVTAKGQTGEETVAKLGQLLEKIHADFPTAEMYYIYSMPCPGYCVDGVYKGEYGDLVNGMKAYVQQNSEWLTGIDMHSVLTDENGNALDGVFKSDNIHLTDYGYTLWTSVLKPIVFLETEE